MNWREIITAWYNKGVGKLELKQIAEERKKICDACPYKQKMMVEYCDLCHCPITAKVFSPNVESCPLKKWKE